MPALLLFLVTVAVPTVISVGLAFTDKRLGRPARFVGLDNFAQILSEPVLPSALRTTVVFALVSVVVKIAGGYILAAVLWRIGKTGRMISHIMLLPWLIPGSAAALLWIWLFYEPSGVLDQAHLTLFGSPARINWLGTPGLALTVLIGLNAWRELPFWSLVFLGSRSHIPQQFVEDFRSCTGSWTALETRLVLPMLLPTLSISTALGFMWSFAEFQSIHIITRGGPSNSTHTIGTLAFELGYGGGIDLGVAIAAFLLVLPIVLAVVVPLVELGTRLGQRQERNA